METMDSLLEKAYSLNFSDKDEVSSFSQMPKSFKIPKYFRTGTGISGTGTNRKRN